MIQSKRFVGILLIFIMLSTKLSAQAYNMNYGLRDDNDFDLKNLAVEIDTYINANNEYDAAVGVGLVCKDEVLYEESYGYANKEEEIMADSDTVYEWGSLTKVLTWISVMQLYEQGKIDLYEDICIYLPEGFLTKLSYDTPVTMMDLMNHTGGFQDSITDVYTSNKDEISELGDYLKECEPVQIYEPGTTVAYSNWGCSLAGYIVECISGEAYCDYVKTHILDPLEMDHTSIEPLRRDNAYVDEKLNEITGYTTNGKEIKGRYYAPDYPAAGAAGTVEDVMKLMQDLLSENNGKLFISASTYKEFFETTRYFANSDISENCHGMWNDFYQLGTVGHYGNTVQFSVHMSLSCDLGLIVMTNQAQEMKINEGLGEVIFGSTIPKRNVEANWSELTFLNCYSSARTIEHGFCKFYHFFQVYTVKKIDDNSLLLSSMMMPMTLTRIGENEYVVIDGFAKGYHIFMDVDSNGVVQKMATSTFDFVPYEPTIVAMETVSFIAFGITFILLCIALIKWIIGLVKKRNYDLFTGAMIIFSMVYYGVVILEMMHLISTAATRNEMLIYIIYYCIYLVIGLGYMIRNVLQKKWNSLKVMTSISYIILALFILYWQMILICI